MNIKSVYLLPFFIIIGITTTGCNYQTSENTSQNSDINFNEDNSLEVWDEFSVLLKEYQDEFIPYATSLMSGTLTYDETIDSLNILISNGEKFIEDLNTLKDLIQSDSGKKAISTTLCITENIKLYGEEILNSLLVDDYDGLDSSVEGYMLSFLPILTGEMTHNISLANIEIRAEEQDIKEVSSYDLSEDIKNAKNNYKKILNDKSIDVSPILEYLDSNYSFQYSIIDLLSYDSEGVIRLKAMYVGNGYSTRLPVSIMIAIRDIKDMGYPIETLEVEFYHTSRRNSNNDSILLYKNSVDNISVYKDEKGIVKVKDFYNGAEVTVLNEILLNDKPDVQGIYEDYINNN